jgi:hypothetical protein
MNHRRLGGLVLAGAMAVGGMITPQAHAAAAGRNFLSLVGGEDPTFDPLNPATAEVRSQPPVRRIDLFKMDAARFPASVAGNAAPCVATLSIGSLSGTAPVVVDPIIVGATTAGLRDNTAPTDGQLEKADIVCDWTDAGGALQHHEAHFAGEWGFAPLASVSSPLQFDALRVGDVSADQVVTLTNVGNTSMRVASAQLAGAAANAFALTSNGCTGANLAPNEACSVAVHFAPLARGDLSAALVFTDNTPDGAQSVALAGTGLEPNILISPTEVRFGNTMILLGSSVQTIRVTNTGNMDLSLGVWALTGDADFKIVADSCSNQVIAASGSCSVTMQFQPVLPGAHSAVIDAVSDAPTSAQHSISLSGSGIILAGGPV